MIMYGDEILSIIGSILKKYEIQLTVEGAFKLNKYILDEEKPFSARINTYEVIREEVCPGILVHGKRAKKFFNLFLTFKNNNKVTSIMFKKQDNKIYTNNYWVRIEVDNRLQTLWKCSMWNNAVIEHHSYAAKDTYYVKTPKTCYYLYKGVKEGPYRITESDGKVYIGNYHKGYAVGEEICSIENNICSKTIYEKQEKIRKYFLYVKGELKYCAYQNNIDPKKQIRVTSSFSPAKNKLNIKYFINDELKATSVTEMLEKGYI